MHEAVLTNAQEHQPFLRRRNFSALARLMHPTEPRPDRATERSRPGMTQPERLKDYHGV